MQKSSWLVSGLVLGLALPLSLGGCGSGANSAGSNGEAGQAGPSYLLGGIGDSISAASMADTSATAGTPFSVSELQERIIYENKSTLSWVSGLEINSQFVRFQSWLHAHGDSTPVTVLNEATPGNTSDDIGKQADALVSAMGSGNYTALKYVTLMIGANDACTSETPSGTPDSRMYTNLMAAFEKLATIKQAEPIRILVSSMPNIPQLGRPEIAQHRTLTGLTCAVVRNQILKFCNPMLTWTTDAEYQTRLAVVVDKNALLQKAVADANRKFANLSVVFSGTLVNREIGIELLAGDCFHPNKSGQTTLSDSLWEDQPWYK